MIAIMWTYSQVVWAYFILDAATLATSKFIEIPPKNADYPIRKEDVRSEIQNFNRKTNTTSRNLTASADTLQPLGLFAAQPSNIQELLQGDSKDPSYSNAQPRYAENFGMVATSSEQRYRGIDPKLSLFSKIDKRKSYYDKKPDRLPKPKGSDLFLTPELYKFKTDIEKETVRTHIRGLKMSPDATAEPTIVRDKPFPKFNHRPSYNYKRPGSLAREETFINPYVYDEPYSYEDGPSTPYAKPVSYQQYTPIPREPYYPTSTGSSYYEPPADYSFPYYPTPEPDPYYYPKPAEPDAYNKYSSGPSYNDFPVEYPPSPPIPPINYHDTHGYFPSAKNRETAGDEEEPEDGRSPANDEDDFDKDFPSAEPTPKTPKKSHRNPNYEVSEYGTDPIETGVKHRNSPKKSRSRQKYRKPYGKANAKPKEDEDEEFDSNYEPPDGFQEDKDDNLDADDSVEDEPPAPAPAPPKQARLRSPSKKQVKRIRSRPNRSRNKRCVKKRKEMSVETELASGGFDEEPSKKMTCLVCENLDTGGTYETCSYESDPKKNSYYEGNEASYRKGNAKNPYKYRMRRQTVTIINSTLPMKRIVRRSYNLDSVGSFTSDVEDFGSDDFTDDDNEDLQEDDDEDLEEYKPTLPAYANEDACTEVTKNGLTCMVCHNPETNGKYKQCSYANDPDKNNYEYAQSSSYGKKDVPYKARHRRQPTKKQKTNPDGMQVQHTTSKEIKIPSDWKMLRNIEQKKIGAINNNFQKLIHSKKEHPDTDALASIANPSYEEQFLTLFPELDNDRSGESLMGEHSLLKELNEKPTFSTNKDTSLPGFSSKGKLGGYFKKHPKKSILDDDDEDTEMSKMMKEFKTKDRSACKKSTKDKMTCYVCDDKDGIKREECMYITENEPTKVSYQESSQTQPEESQAKSSQKREVYYKSPLKIFKYKYIPTSELKDQPAAGSVIHKTISDKSARKYGSPHREPSAYSNVKIHTEKTYSLKTLPAKIGKRDLVGAHTHEQQVQASNKKQVRKRKAHPRSEEESDSESESESEDPEETGEYAAAEVVPEVDPDSPNGLFSDETRDVYSTELKETLPRYMVEKTDHEKLLDEYMSKM